MPWWTEGKDGPEEYRCDECNGCMLVNRNTGMRIMFFVQNPVWVGTGAGK